MKHAFKEWAIVVDALMRGRQTVILRKGGLIEGKKGFEVQHPEFLLFPTQFHQQRESVVPEAQARYDDIAPHFRPEGVLRLECFARVADWRRLETLTAARALRDLHIWRDEVIEQRFDWTREKHIHVMAVRVFKLRRPVELPMLETYSGCKSWVELAEDISPDGAHAVLDDAAFTAQLQLFHRTLEPGAVLEIPPIESDVRVEVLRDKEGKK
jgi:hypothetical protein